MHQLLKLLRQDGRTPRPTRSIGDGAAEKHISSSPWYRAQNQGLDWESHSLYVEYP